MRAWAGYAVGVVVIAGAMIGCSTGPKSYTLDGNWMFSGGIVSGQMISVIQTGTSLTVCIRLGSSDATVPGGSNVPGHVSIPVLLPDDGDTFMPSEFNGHFVNAHEIVGTVQATGQSVTLTPATLTYTCDFAP